jgi:hypothetical protein
MMRQTASKEFKISLNKRESKSTSLLMNGLKIVGK